MQERKANRAIFQAVFDSIAETVAYAMIAFIRPFYNTEH